RVALYRGFELHYSRGTSLIDDLEPGAVYEPEVSRVLADALRGAPAGTHFLDIGANIGLITLNVLSEPGLVHVVAFEPGSHQAGLLRQTVAANRLTDRVTIVESALGRHEGTARFAVHSTRHASGDGF